MPDTMTGAKTVGALCGALLVLLLGQWVADSIYHIGSSSHGDEHSGSVIFADLVESHDSESEEDAPAVEFATLLADADPDSGARVYAKCKACHKIDEPVNGVGPHLVAIVDRVVGSIADFRYSSPMAELGGVWDIERLNAFILNPKAYLPGTKMSFAGLSKDTDRADLVAYLQSLQN